ncbi:MAG: class I SAM-dependent methyltransferase family protein, partial [Candidatus Nanohaloarchaea archaeon]|nr:class I SAM-dependent methyltransferase family protein [Candidatus Nanohaloarchaea archaeon]
GKEIIHVWFAGVGPYAVLFADSKNPERVHAVEKNPKACKYMEDNIEINGVEETVVPHCGDVGKIVPELEKADRIVMPLPKSADQFLELAFERSKKGAVIHYYRFAEKEENNVKWSGVVEEVEEKAEKAGREFEIVDKTVCGHYAPYMDRVCIDVKVK